VFRALLSFFALSFLVFVHELGHFLAGKFLGARVEEFGLGYPPRVWGKRFGETLYSLNLIPFGGFTKFPAGDVDDVGTISGKSAPRRVVILLAGVLGNFVLGWLILSFLFATGKPTFVGRVVVTGVAPSSPAAEAGIREGEAILALNGKEIALAEDLSDEVGKHLGQEVILKVLASDCVGEQGSFFEECWREVRVVPRKDPPIGEGAMGVEVVLEGEMTEVTTSIWRAPLAAFGESLRLFKDMLAGYGKLLRSLVRERRVPKGLAGPVGVYGMAKAASGLGSAPFLQFLAFLSFGLGLFNLMPLPALDGGQVLFVVIEVIRGKRIGAHIERWINLVGIGFLILLMILVTIQDVRGLL